MSPPPKIIAGFAGFACLAALIACQSGDGDSLDAFSRSGSLTAPGVVGRFETRAMTMKDGTARMLDYLIEGNNEHEIVLLDGMEIERGAVVRAEGDRDDNGVLVVSDFTLIEAPPQALIDPDPYAPRRLATILLTWEGAGGISNGVAEADMYSGAKSTNVFYGENSYGRETMAGRVFGPYTIERPTSCSATAIANAALQVFAERGHRESDWSQIMYYFPDGVSGCGWAGLANVGSVGSPARDSWYNGSFGCVVRNQEIGHNYGMGHSHAYNCPEGVVLGEGCSHVEYGDPYDPMGGGCGHINAVQKGFMGWLEGCNYVSGTQDGQYNIAPLELPCDGTQALRVPTTDGRWYYLEYRQPIGEFDTSLSGGVIVHAAGDINDFGPSPYILDLGLGGLMQEGDSFTDPQGGVTFTIAEDNGTHAVIDVQYPEGAVQTAPTCLDGSTPQMEAGAVGSLACAELPWQADDVPPTIQITSPADGASFDTQSDFVIRAEAADDRGVMELELYIDGEPRFKLYEPPWEWEVNDIPDGRYEFGIVARDTRSWTPSNAVTIEVGPRDAGADGSSGEVDETLGGTTATETDTEVAPDDDTDTDADSGVGAADDSGCSCSAGQDGSPAIAGLWLVALGWIRRRR